MTNIKKKIVSKMNTNYYPRLSSCFKLRLI